MTLGRFAFGFSVEIANAFLVGLRFAIDSAVCFFVTASTRCLNAGFKGRVSVSSFPWNATAAALLIVFRQLGLLADLWPFWPQSLHNWLRGDSSGWQCQQLSILLLEVVQVSPEEVGAVLAREGVAASAAFSTVDSRIPCRCSSADSALLAF